MKDPFLSLTPEKIKTPDPFLGSSVRSTTEDAAASLTKITNYDQEFTQSDIPSVNDDSSGRSLNSIRGSSGPNPIASLLKAGRIGLDVGVKAVNAGLVDIVDLGPTLVNSISQQVGGQGVVPTIRGTEFGQAATAYGEENHPFLLRAVTDGVRFFSGGVGLASAIKAATATKAGAIQAGLGEQTTGNLILQELSRVNPALEAGAAAGAGAGGALATEITDNPYLKMAFEFFGGVAGAAKTSGTNKAERKAAKILQDSVVDKDASLDNIYNSPERIFPVEAADDLGIVNLYHRVVRRDLLLDQKYKTYVSEQMDLLNREMEEVLGRAAEGTDEGVFQDYVAQKRDLLLDLHDQRIKQAEWEIGEIQKLSGRNSDDVEQSIAADEAMYRAEQDINAQARVLWSLADDGVIVNTTRLKEAAKEVVSSLSKTTDPSSTLIKKLETIIGKRIVRQEEGYTISDELSEIILNDTEKAAELASARSVFEAEKRAAEAGQNGNLVDGRYYRMLSEATLDSLLDAKLVGKEYSQAYDVARQFTAKQKESLNSGRLGTARARTLQGGVRVPPEQFAPSVYGDNRFSRSAADTEINQLEALQRSSVEGPVNTGRVFEEYLLTQFQRKLKDGPDKAQEFLDDHRTLLNRHPRIEKEITGAVEKLRKEEGIIESSKQETRRIQKDALYKMFDIRGERIVGHILSQTKSRELMSRVEKIIKGNELAIKGFKADVSEKLMEKMFPPTGNVNFASTAAILKQMDPILSSSLYSASDRKVIQNALSEIQKRAKVLKTGPTGGEAVVSTGIFNRLLAKLAGATIVSRITSGAGSIILAGAASRAGDELINGISENVVKQMLADALTDRALMIKLLSLDDSARAETELLGLVRQYSPHLFAQQNKQEKQEDEEVNTQSSKKSNVDKILSRLL